MGKRIRKRIEVDLIRQVLEAYDGTERVCVFDCVSGDEAHPTDPGTFHIFWKHHPHRSRKYNVDMNYAMFFTHDGKAIHQYHGLMPLSVVRTMKTGVSDWFGSHGCVRLTEDDAKALFKWTPVGTPVHIR
jgi:lipoprotein-anchoring transpeptidase ErfK/SrfK